MSAFCKIRFALVVAILAACAVETGGKVMASQVFTLTIGGSAEDISAIGGSPIKSVAFTDGDAAAAIRLEISLNGTNFVPFQNMTRNTSAQVDAVVTHVRAVRTGGTGGAVTISGESVPATGGIAMNVPASGYGNVLDLTDAAGARRTVMLTGGSVGSELYIYGSNNGSNFVPVGDLLGPTSFEMTDTSFRYLRLRRIGGTGGVVVIAWSSAGGGGGGSASILTPDGGVIAITEAAALAVDPSTAQGVAGGDLSVVAGEGYTGTTQNGTNGGNASVVGGAGGDTGTSATNGGNGGVAAVTGGAAGQAGGGSAQPGYAGQAQVRGGKGADATTTYAGTPGGQVQLAGGEGGAASSAREGGTGGPIQILTGAPGAGAPGGSFNLVTADGGPGLDSVFGPGAAGNIAIQGGQGAQGVAGFGGSGGASLNLQAGSGGPAKGDGTTAAGAGGSVTIQAGSAGNANTGTGANGGDVYLGAGYNTGAATTPGAVRVAGPFAFVAESQTINANGNTLQINAGAVFLNPNGTNRSMSSTPTVQTTGARSGQVITFVNVGANTITLSSNDTVAGSALSLGAATRVIGAGGSITLIWTTGLARWVETGFNPGAHT